MNPFFSVLPALITIGVAFWCRNVMYALFSGVFSALLIVSKANLFVIPGILGLKLYKVFDAQNLTSFASLIDSERLMIFLFLIILGTLISMTMNSGSGMAYLNFTGRIAKTRSGVQLSSLFLSALLFIDDYLSVIMTSCIMPRLTDRFGLPRVRLAFLITAMAAPLCALIPISSWGAVITLFIADAGVSAAPGALIKLDSFRALLYSIPMMFYCSLVVIAAFVLAIFDIDFTYVKGQVSSGPKACVKECREVCCLNSSATIFDFVLPVGLTIVSILVALLHTGKFFSHFNIAKALAQNNAPQGLFFGSLVAIVFSIGFYLLRGLIVLRDVFAFFVEGFFSMKDSLIILTTSAVLSEFLKGELETCNMITQVLLPFVSQQFLPLSFFIVCAMISFSIGSSWATMSVMFPIATSITAGLVAPELMIAPVFGAILSGVIFGSSLSPMSDLITITSRNTGVDVIEYIKTQVAYLIPVSFGAGAAFSVSTAWVIKSYTSAVFYGLITGVLVMILFLGLFRICFSKKI